MFYVIYGFILKQPNYFQKSHSHTFSKIITLQPYKYFPDHTVNIANLIQYQTIHFTSYILWIDTKSLTLLYLHQLFSGISRPCKNKRSVSVIKPPVDFNNNKNYSNHSLISITVAQQDYCLGKKN